MTNREARREFLKSIGELSLAISPIVVGAGVYWYAHRHTEAPSAPKLPSEHTKLTATATAVSKSTPEMLSRKPIPDLKKLESEVTDDLIKEIQRRADDYMSRPYEREGNGTVTAVGQIRENLETQMMAYVENHNPRPGDVLYVCLGKHGLSRRTSLGE